MLPESIFFTISSPQITFKNILQWYQYNKDNMIIFIAIKYLFDLKILTVFIQYLDLETYTKFWNFFDNRLCSSYNVVS